MSNLSDYLTWRGDLSFGSASLCPVDALIFSMLAYLDLDGIVPPAPTAEPVRLAAAAKAYFARPTVAKGELPVKHEQLLRTLADTGRFSSLRLFAAKKILNRAKGMQFGAVSFLLPGQNIFVAFEGTDDTLVGWKEDFRMSYECPVPAQLAAVQYLREVAAAYPLRRIFTGGHSKGGNLAMYAAVNAGDHLRHRIRAVYNHDGPGFCDSTLASAAYLELRDRIFTYLPESSIVAVLLEHDVKYQIVKSAKKGLMQHDGYSWEVLGNDFVYTKERTAFGKRTEAIVDHFVNTTSPERRRRFSEALFSVLEASEQDTVSGVLSGKRWRQMLSAYADMPDDMRVLLTETLAVLGEGRRAAKKNTNAPPLQASEKSS
ncbi:MAG: DUF2974 domain-containing protein [Clostridia bacterium]|nr:DUF2974 domain-containing protein [Clostridia bacterium]